jgi:uncharacterized protein
MTFAASSDNKKSTVLEPTSSWPKAKSKAEVTDVSNLIKAEMPPNVFLLAADNHTALLPLLRQNPSLASKQDEHGYSLLHAAASYNHVSLLRSLVNEFQVDPGLKDEDGETCLFVTESVLVATCLVEELHLDTNITNCNGLTAVEKIEEEGEFLEVASYLRRSGGVTSDSGDFPPMAERSHPPPLPTNVTVDVGTMADQQLNSEAQPDPEFKRRIEELAAKEDFHGEERQRELRALITDAVRGVTAEERDTRRRLQ